MAFPLCNSSRLPAISDRVRSTMLFLKQSLLAFLLVIAHSVMAYTANDALTCYFPGSWAPFDHNFESSWREVQQIPGVGGIRLNRQYTLRNRKRNVLEKRGWISPHDGGFPILKEVVCNILRFQVPEVSCDYIPC